MNELLEEAKKSYITKEQLIDMINSSKFDYVEELELKVITGFREMENNDGSPYIQPMGYKISVF